jgi:hypothetical protein
MIQTLKPGLSRRSTNTSAPWSTSGIRPSKLSARNASPTAASRRTMIYPKPPTNGSWSHREPSVRYLTDGVKEELRRMASLINPISQKRLENKALAKLLKLNSEK